MSEHARSPLPVGAVDVWLRRLIGWIYVAIGAAIWAGVISKIGPFEPAPQSRDVRDLEWAPIVFPFFVFFGGVFAFAGYWTMTHPRVHRPASIVIIFVAMTAILVAYRHV